MHTHTQVRLSRDPLLMSRHELIHVSTNLVSYAAVLRVVTQRSSPELIPLLPDLKTRIRCLELTETEQIKQFLSLFNNFFGVTSISDGCYFASVYLTFLVVF